MVSSILVGVLQWFYVSLREGMAVGPEGRDLRGGVGPEGRDVVMRFVGRCL